MSSQTRALLTSEVAYLSAGLVDPLLAEVITAARLRRPGPRNSEADDQLALRVVQAFDEGFTKREIAPVLRRRLGLPERDDETDVKLVQRWRRRGRKLRARLNGESATDPLPRHAAEGVRARRKTPKAKG